MPYVRLNFNGLRLGSGIAMFKPLINLGTGKVNNTATPESVQPQQKDDPTTNTYVRPTYQDSILIRYFIAAALVRSIARSSRGYLSQSYDHFATNLEEDFYVWPK